MADYNSSYCYLVITSFLFYSNSLYYFIALSYIECPIGDLLLVLLALEFVLYGELGNGLPRMSAINVGLCGAFLFTSSITF